MQTWYQTSPIAGAMLLLGLAPCLAQTTVTGVHIGTDGAAKSDNGTNSIFPGYSVGNGSSGGKLTRLSDTVIAGGGSGESD